MIIRRLKDIMNSARDVNWGYGQARRLILAEDNMGFSFSDTLVDAGADYQLEYKNHLESCYIVEGTGWLKFGNEEVRLEPGVLYVLNKHDQHRIVAETEIRMLCVFNPALRGDEKHDFDSGPSGY